MRRRIYFRYEAENRLRYVEESRVNWTMRKERRGKVNQVAKGKPRDQEGTLQKWLNYIGAGRKEADRIPDPRDKRYKFGMW